MNFNLIPFTIKFDGKFQREMFERPLTESIRIFSLECLMLMSMRIFRPEEVTFTPEPLRHVPLGAGESPRCSRGQRFGHFLALDTGIWQQSHLLLSKAANKRNWKDWIDFSFKSIKFDISVFQRKMWQHWPFLAFTCKWFNQVWRYWPWNYWRKS